MEYIYAGLLIHKLGGKINEATVKKVIESAGGKPDEGKVKALVAALEDINIDKTLEEATIQPVATAQAVVERKEEKKEEKEEESKEAAAGLGALFG